MGALTQLYSRLLETRIVEAMADTPVVLMAGPRQAGKTTLAREIAQRGMDYLTLDDELSLLAAKEDPVGLIRERDRLVIDEVQRAPDLLLAIKRAVDQDRRPGRFLLTGSANLMALPKVADSLAGRMEILRLLPLSQSEIFGNRDNWIDAIFADRILDVTHALNGSDLIETVLKGGYPEVIRRNTLRRRTAWARQYIDALIQRDVRDIADIDKLNEMPVLLRALAQTAGQICNYSQLGSELGLDHKSVARYVGVLENMFLLTRVAPYARNRLSRVVKSPKIQFVDAGLSATLSDLTPEVAKSDRSRFGPVLESFVYGELLKHSAHAEGDYEIYFYRDRDKFEVDFVIENAAREVVGVEVKSTATVRSTDLRGLKRLAAALGSQFRAGVVLYDGTERLPLGDGLWAAPLSALWGRWHVHTQAGIRGGHAR